MTDRSTREVKEECRAMHRSVAGILEALGASGILLRDREGEAYDYGLPEKVVAAESRAGLSQEMVLETVRPSLFHHNKILRPGEIIIAVPENAPPRPL